MAQATEKKGVLRSFWEGFKEGWSSSNATAQETPPPAPEEVIEAADEWDVDELPETVVAAEAIDAADEWDMLEPMMTTAEPPQEKRGLAAFFEGFKEGWDNAKGSVTVTNTDEGNPWLRTSWLDKDGDDEYPVLSYYDDRIRTDRVNPDVTHFLWSRGEFDCDRDDRLIY
ncbi:hypothetical protein [Cardiobacterium hominis]|jgi:hypothetical protein|uniref:hypothetical protein n=1 Tax=Cardiobacterium hominis TaxID=2718 RepID=UPI0028EDD1A7|nr:hypothetical protein [Cardiobacterium hominis]